jgi:pyruvate/2-oxoacid:ferredoxin oxidoreductase alpha subunit
MLWPLPTDQIDAFLKNKRQVIVPEVNYAGQFAQLLKTHYQNVEFTRLNVYGGQPFSVSRVVESVDKAPSANGTVDKTRTEAALHA